AVQHNDYRAPFVSYHSDSQRDSSKQRETDEHCHRAERDDEVLLNYPARAFAELKGGEKILQPIVHQHDFGLFEGRVRSTGTHGHADVRGGETGRVVDTIPDHGHEAIPPGEGLNDGDLLLRFQFGTEVVELEFFFE